MKKLITFICSIFIKKPKEHLIDVIIDDFSPKYYSKPTISIGEWVYDKNDHNWYHQPEVFDKDIFSPEPKEVTVNITDTDELTGETKVDSHSYVIDDAGITYTKNDILNRIDVINQEKPKTKKKPAIKRKPKK